MFLPIFCWQKVYDVSLWIISLFVFCASVQSVCSSCDKCQEWYHGDCVNVTEREAEYIKFYYCKRCRRKDPKLSVVHMSKEEVRAAKDEKRRKSHKEKKKRHHRDREERDKVKKKSSDSQSLPPKKSKVESKRHSSVDSRETFVQDTNEVSLLKLSDSEDAWEPPKPVLKEKQSKKRKESAITKSTSETGNVKRKRSRRSSGSDSDYDNLNSLLLLKGSRQCYGHKCKKEARAESKYCSDQCGINLASLRIMQTLPDRIREWNMAPCEAEKRNRRELEQGISNDKRMSLMNSK